MNKHVYLGVILNFLSPTTPSLHAMKTEPPQKPQLRSETEQSRTALHSALYHDDLKSVLALLEWGSCIIDAQDSKGKTPLLIAIERGHKDIALKLLSAHEADVNIADNAGITPLQQAIKMDDHGLLQNLLWFGADPSIGDPLASALKSKNWRAACILLHMGAPLNASHYQTLLQDNHEAIFHIYSPTLDYAMLFIQGNEYFASHHINYLTLAGQTEKLLKIYTYALNNGKIQELCAMVIEQERLHEQTIDYVKTVQRRFKAVLQVDYTTTSFNEEAYKREMFKSALTLPHSTKKLIAQGWGNEFCIKELLIKPDYDDTTLVYRRRPKERARIVQAWRDQCTSPPPLIISYRNIYFYFGKAD